MLLSLVGCYGPAALPPAFWDCRASEGDPWTLQAAGSEDRIAVVDGKLKLRVAYSGGCAEHAIQICWDGAFLERYPVVARLDLLHKANNDKCDGQRTEELSFDLAPLRARWQRSYGAGPGAMSLRLGDERTKYTFDE